MESAFIVRVLGDDTRTEEELRKLLISDTIDESELIVRKFEDSNELNDLIVEFAKEDEQKGK